MRSLAERLAGAALLLALALTGCGTAVPQPTDSHPDGTTPEASTGGPRPTVASPRDATAEPTAAVDLPEPGRPWDGPALLAAMAASARPDRVPPMVRTPGVADLVARSIWTFDGSPWDDVAVDGFCGTTECTVEIAGSHAGAVGDDLWVVEVDPDSMAIEIVSADVRSLPPDLVSVLDGLARGATDLDGMVLGTARWLPPPADRGLFGLSYRSGGEEGACGREIVLDVTTGAIVHETSAGC